MLQEMRAAERNFKRDFVLSGLAFGALQSMYKENAGRCVRPMLALIEFCQMP